MKLIYCRECTDVVRLFHENRRCQCGKSWGRYIDERNAEIGGPCIPVGIAWGSLAWALADYRKRTDKSILFDAFLIEHPCRTVKHVDEVSP